jgi:hypothetical protein
VRHKALLHAAACLLSLALLAWAVVHSGPRHGEVVVHVTEPDLEVSLDGRTYRIEGLREDPIVCDLPAGAHTLVVTRQGRLLRRETFEVVGGQGVVLTAWASPLEWDVSAVEPLATGASSWPTSAH